MRFLTLLLFLFGYLAACHADDSPLRLVFRDATGKNDSEKSWRMSIQNISKDPVLLCLDEGVHSVTPVRPAPGESYSMATGPNILEPLYLADIKVAGHPAYRYGKRSHDSLLQIEFQTPPPGLQLQPGDTLSIYDGRFTKLPESATVKVAIYTSAWKELSLNWTPKANQDALAAPHNFLK